ncbi:amino acid adenylation domain-containing protein, partial [Microbulbifer sp. TYP-18]|uniref:amino acid adenylation domain-containing protein n=1 Tax=Microbulbifer sp. TYP-18 TaxID=3230024 RepID=UPI0034C5F32F
QARPDAVALVCQDQQLTYGELDRRANGLAQHLIAAGVEPEMPVGLCVHRSPLMVVGMLGILKAGACYVPLDPAYPPKRLAHVLSHSGIRTLVTQQALSASGVVGVAQVSHRIDLDRLPTTGVEPTPELPVHPDQLAYVIYTSGSTGQPKGVRLTHANAVNFLSSMQAAPGIKARDRLLAVTTLSFDIALLELLLPLSVGACVSIVPEECVMQGDWLAAALADQHISLMQATPVTWKLLLQSGWPGRSQLAALVGGEAVPPALAATLADKVGSLWNMYGPTETCVWSAVQALDAGLTSGGTVPIGRPIHNTQLYILDREGQLCPEGVVGEVHIGGAGLSPGYFKQPGLSALRFVPNPYAQTPGERLYCTGDLGRLLPGSGGALECLGRIDQQVKVRGFRIELGEVETALQQHAQVQDAVAVVQNSADSGDEPGDARLVAYVVMRGGDTEAASA